MRQCNEQITVYDHGAIMYSIIGEHDKNAQSLKTQKQAIPGYIHTHKYTYILIYIYVYIHKKSTEYDGTTISRQPQKNMTTMGEVDVNNSATLIFTRFCSLQEKCRFTSFGILIVYHIQLHFNSVVHIAS